MFREIKKKKLILENRKPYSREAILYMVELDQVDWVYSSMHLDGSSITRQGVQRILKGEFLVEATVEDHLLVENHKSAMKLAYNMADMGTELDIKYIFKLYEALADPDQLEYRKKNPVLVSFDYNPPHPQDIEEQMNRLVHWMNHDTCDSNPLLKAAYLHNKLLEIYPFEFYTEAVARTLMNYELIRNAYPPVYLDLREQEYHKGIMAYLKKGEIHPIYSVLERSVFQKMEIMLQLTNEA